MLLTMNPQLKELLVYKGKEVAMSCEPLSQYLLQLKSPPLFYTACKANERGYLGKWAILREELYLTEFIAMLENKDEVSIHYLFPGQQIVHAEWFNGEIVLNEGKLLALKDENNPAIYEKDVHMEFIKGRLVKTTIIENKIKITSEITNEVSSTIKLSST
jgi:hypothetical protein